MNEWQSKVWDKAALSDDSLAVGHVDKGPAEMNATGSAFIWFGFAIFAALILALY
jgi:hypothetical protein